MYAASESAEIAMSPFFHFWKIVIYFLFPPLIVAFMFYVGQGYYFSFKTSYPDWGVWQIRGIVAVVALLIYGFLVIAGRALVEVSGASPWRRRLLKGGSLLILLLTSGYGVLAACMLLLEGPTILRESIATTREALLRIQAESAAILARPEVDALASRVRSLAKNLDTEIRNPVACGIGPGARRAIDGIKAVLPGVEILTGTGRGLDCKDRATVEAVARAYGSMIDKALGEYLAQPSRQMAERASLSREIRLTVDQEVARLNEKEKALIGVNNFLFDQTLFEAIVPTITQANAEYIKLYNKLSGFSNLEKFKLKSYLANNAYESVTSLVQLVNVLIERSNRPTTYIYIMVPFAIDFLAVFLVVNAVRVDREREARRRRLNRDRTLRESGVTYIWSPIELG